MIDEELLNYYGEQLELIREINKGVVKGSAAVTRDNRRLRRENGFLICFVISLMIWIATS